MLDNSYNMNYNRGINLFLEVLPMKKLKSLLVTALICVMACCCFLFTGCAEKGTYKFETLNYNDGETAITLEIGEKFLGTELTKETFVLLMREDTFILRTCTTYTEGNATYMETTVQTGTWMKGFKKEIYLVYDSGIIEIAEKKGNKIIFETDGVTLTLKK